MLDFIVDNYKRQTFYSPNHPTSNVLLELARRILKFIDISDTTFSDNDWLMSGDNVLNNQDVPIYPKVKEIMEMGFTEQQAKEALEKNDEDVQKAINFLIGG